MAQERERDSPADARTGACNDSDFLAHGCSYGLSIGSW